jgi:hypothetical protein
MITKPSQYYEERKKYEEAMEALQALDSNDNDILEAIEVLKIFLAEPEPSIEDIISEYSYDEGGMMANERFDDEIYKAIYEIYSDKNNQDRYGQVGIVNYTESNLKKRMSQDAFNYLVEGKSKYGRLQTYGGRYGTYKSLNPTEDFYQKSKFKRGGSVRKRYEYNDINIPSKQLVETIDMPDTSQPLYRYGRGFARGGYMRNPEIVGNNQDGGYMAKGGMVVTQIADIPNFKQRLKEGKITYRGLGMGKVYDDFYKLAGESGTRIKVDGKEYYITDTEFDSFSRNPDGTMRIRFSAPARKGYADGGVMAKGGETKRVRFQDKVDAISNRLEGTEVPKRLRKDYGKTYDKKEANEAGRRIAGSIKRNRM